MSILKNYNENGSNLLNLSYDGFGPKPLVNKGIPSDESTGVLRNGSVQITSRVDDVVRISKLLATTPQGIKYLGKEALLTLLGNEGKIGNGFLRETIIGTGKLIGTTLGQVAVSGTGLHFIKGNIANKYFNEIYLATKDPDRLSIITPNGKATRNGLYNEEFIPNPYLTDTYESTKDVDTLGKIAPEGFYGDIGPKTQYATSGSLVSFNSGDKTIKEPTTRVQLSTGDVLLNSPVLTPLKKEQRVKLGDPSKPQVVKRTNYTQQGEGTQDLINLTPPLRANTDDVFSKYGRDFIKFRFHLVKQDVVLFFRAYLNHFQDYYTGNVTGHKYIGRAEDFYTYSGFNRSFSLGFKIAAQTREELRPLYQKIVWLASSTAPSYGNYGFMQGTIVKLTMGSYLYDTPGYITSVNYGWQTDYPWEIATTDPEGNETGVQELPHVLDCSIHFTPIHSFVPEVGSKPFITNPNTVDRSTNYVGEAPRSAKSFSYDGYLKELKGLNESR